MKFSQYKYERPNYEEIKSKFENLVKQISKSTTYKEQKKHIKDLNKIRNDIETMSTISSIRYSINTQDKFYEEERAYWDEHSPLYEELNSKFYKSIVESVFCEDIENDYGKQFVDICKLSLKAFSNEIVNLLQEENKLCSEYTKLLASAKINFEGKETNLSGLGKYMIDTNRDMRKKSSDKYYGYFKENEDKFDDIFDKLVKIRAEIADKLGFNNFIELGYVRMKRTDYDSKMVEKFRSQVLEYIVPVANKLYKRQVCS